MYNDDPCSIMAHSLDARPHAQRPILEFLGTILRCMNLDLGARSAHVTDDERIAYLKAITSTAGKKPRQKRPHVRVCPRPLHSSRLARDAACKGHARRARGTRPTRARP